jgi:hypothetical protein
MSEHSAVAGGRGRGSIKNPNCSRDLGNMEWKKWCEFNTRKKAHN